MQKYGTFKKFPNNITAPFAEHYHVMNWEDGFEKWNLVRFSTPSDGNCLFHAIANSFFVPYHTEILNGKKISRREIITYFREELSDKLSEKIDNSPNSQTYYDTLNEGNTHKFSKNVPEFSIDYMKEQLKSSVAIGYGYIEFLSNVLDKDIYILDGSRFGIYISDELPLTIKGTRSSIILYYDNGHYELIGIQDNDLFHTIFSHEHSFVRFLYNIVSKIIANK